MTLAYWCVFIAALLPYLSTVIAKVGGRGYTNCAPRDFLEKQVGWRKRAHWSQLNGFEAFPAFAAAVIIAHLRFADQTLIDNLAVTFVSVRILYVIFYIADKAALRSLVWFIGFLCMVTLFLI